VHIRRRGGVDELTDGTGGFVDAVMGMAIDQYQKSRTTPLIHSADEGRSFTYSLNNA
jgi:hypothetical protein